MQVTIWHNPNCSKSRDALAAIQAAGITPQVVEYLKTPPSEAELRDALRRMGITARDLLRLRGTPAAELGLDAPGATEDTIIAAMLRHPVLIERPVVLTDRGGALCRPAERLDALLAGH